MSSIGSGAGAAAVALGLYSDEPAAWIGIVLGLSAMAIGFHTMYRVLVVENGPE